MTARTSAPPAPRRHPWLTVGLSASLSSCSQWLDVPSEPAVVAEQPPRITGPVAPPQWQPPLEGGRYYRQRDPPSADSRPRTSEPRPSAVTPPVEPMGSGGGGRGSAAEPEETGSEPEETGSEPPAPDGAVLEPDGVANVDAGGAPPPPPPPPACGGYELFGICWYLGEPGASCEHACAAHGGYDDAASVHVGTARQGGSREDCVLVLNALGQRYRVRSIEREEGVGCHLAGDEADPYWASHPGFSASACLADVRIACGCNE